VACRKPSAESEKAQQKQDAEVIEAISLSPEEMKAAAFGALDEFFEATDTISRAKTVRDGPRLLPLMQDYYDERKNPPPALGRISKGKEAQFDGVPMVFFDIEAFTGPHYLIAVVWDGERFLVDWESLTAYGTVDWSDFLEEKPSDPQEMRVYLMEARGIPSIPGTEEGSAVFRIEHRDHPQPLIATAGAALAGNLSPLVKGRRVPVTLTLSWKPIGPGGAPIPVILSIVSPSWSPRGR